MNWFYFGLIVCILFNYKYGLIKFFFEEIWNKSKDYIKSVIWKKRILVL